MSRVRTPDDPAAAARPPSRRTSAETREHILAVAARLFYAEGIRATGVDTVASRAEVAPTTLYRLFDSKDDLVAAYVERCSSRYKAVLATAMSSAAPTPPGKILAIIDAFADDVQSPACRGCPFLMVLAEYPDPDTGAHAKAVAHKAWVRDLFHELVAELALTTELRDAESLADGLVLLAEGMYGSVQALGPSGPVTYGRACAEALIDAAQRVADGATRPAAADSSMEIKAPPESAPGDH
jgi:AcrR family transcriptional regulator